MGRVIVILETKAGIVYEIEKETNGFLIKSIVFSQNGLTSINQGAGAAYQIRMQNPHVDKEEVFKVIPYDEMREVLFIKPVADDTESSETPTDMKRV